MPTEPITFYAASSTFTLTLTLDELLVLGASLRVMDDDLLEDEGVLPGIVEQVQPLFDRIDSVLTDTLGDNWPADVSTFEKLDEEARPDAPVGPREPLFGPGSRSVGKWESMIGDAFK